MAHIVDSPTKVGGGKSLRSLKAKRTKDTFTQFLGDVQMKKALLLMLVVCMALGVTAVAENGDGVKGKMFASGYAGYALGFGDLFKDYEETFGPSRYKYSFDAGIGFGGAFHYGVTPKLMVGGEVGLQSYKSELEVTGDLFGFNEAGSNTNTELNVLATALYALNYAAQQNALFLTFGVGNYGGLDAIGLSFGIMYMKMMSTAWALYFMPRMHYVLSDPDAAMMFQLLVGASFPIGGK